MGQAPGDGEELAFMEMGNMSINCPDAIIEAFHFENLKIKVTTSDFFKFKNQAFHVSTISWKNCEISDLVRTMWYQEVDAAQKQIADHIVIENCRFLGLEFRWKWPVRSFYQAGRAGITTLCSRTLRSMPTI